MAQWWENDRKAGPDAGSGSAGDWWKRDRVDAAPSQAAEPGKRTWADHIADTGISLAKGVVGVPEAAVGLLDIATFGRVGKALEDVGYRPAEAKQILEGWYSDAQKEANRAVAAEDTFTGKLGAAVANPSTIAHAAVESLPLMFGGGLVGRGIIKAAPKVAPWLAGGIGEGVVGAGSAAEQIRGENPDRVLTPTQAGAALGSGAGTAVLGAAGGKVAAKMGLPDVDTMIAAGGAKAVRSPAGFTKALLGSGISEGVFEEMPQSAQERMWQNFATGKPLMDGVGGDAAMGLLTGGAMGAAGGGYNAAVAPRDRQPSVDAGQDIPAADVLGSAPAAPPSDAEKALTATPTPLRPERIATVPGLPTTFSTEAGAKLEGQYALVEADQALASHDTDLRPNAAYPVELQPRDRTRAASEAQISGIVGKLDPARLGQSATAGDGAPIIGEDGLVESGNARTIALQRVYRANGQKAQDYKSWLRSNAGSFGLTPEQVDGMRQPMLVRVRATPVDRAEFARQANASTVAAMSPLEQARADSARIDSMDDLRPDEQGEFSTSRDFIRRFVGRLPATEQAGMIDAGGQLSASGYARVRNAVLAKAYGDSPVLARMVESMDDNLRNVSRAMMIAAPRVAQVRSMVEAGRLHAADITPDLVAAVSELERIKQRGGSVQDALAQRGLTGERYTPEQRTLLEFLNENLRRPRKIADFIGAYADALEAAGDPNQGNLLGETQAPTVADLLAAATRATASQPEAETTATTPAAASQANPAPAANDEPADGDWRAFGPETGTLGVPRAEMPQVKMKRRPELFEFLQTRGIGHEQVMLDADTLKPTQAEYSEDKTARAAEITAPDDPRNQVLVSSDGYIIDGHHRWLASARAHGQISAVRFDAPAGRVLDAMMQFPGTTVSRESAGAVAPSPRDLAVQDLKNAMGDLGDFLTRHMRAAVVEEDKPKFMPIMVGVMDAAIRVVGSDLKRVMAWVRDHLRRNKDVLPGWNKIPATWWREAAEKALAGLQNRGQQLGLFTEAEQGQPDLFADADARVPADAPQVATPEGDRGPKGNVYRAYTLTPADKAALLRRFPPTHPRVIADHISAQSLQHMHLVKDGPATGEVIGTFDKDGMQALIVRVNGSETTASGAPFHVSWSTDFGKHSREIGPAIARLGFERLAEPVPLDLSAGITYEAPMRDLSPGSARQAGETDKAFAKRVIDKRPVPISLPEAHSLYFKMDGAKVVSIADLVSTKSAEENAQGGENGAKRMQAAAKGELSKRGPITVMPSDKQPGKYEVVDGNGTLTSVSRYGWKSLPVKVVDRAAGLAMIEADKAKDRGAAVKAPARLMQISEFKEGDYLPAAKIDRAKAAIERLKGDGPPPEPQITPQEREQAIALLRPMFEIAKQQKPAFDAKVEEVAKASGAMGWLLAPLKRIERSAEKLVLDNEMQADKMRDLLRSTIVVSSFTEAQRVVDEIYRTFEVSKGRIKNRTDAALSAPDLTGSSGFVESGYGDVLVNVRISGIDAEILINVPEMIAAKEGQGHKLYDIERVLPRESPVARAAVAAQQEFYAAASSAASLRHAASERDIGYDDGGQRRDGTSLPSTSLKTPSEGIDTANMPESVSKNSEPAGNLSGTFIAPSPVESVSQKGQNAAQKGARDDADATDGRSGAEGPGAETVRGSEGRGQADGVRAGEGGRDQQLGRAGDDGSADARRLGQAEPAAAGDGRPDERGPSKRHRNRARRGAAVPAGRDLKPKSGLNYRFTDDDISPPGSWRQRAAWNVEAVELVRKLQADKRTPTADEQKVLARWVGWGASDLAQNLFSDKLDSVEEVLGQYERAAAEFERRSNQPMRKDGNLRYGGAPTGFYDAFSVLRAADPKIDYYETLNAGITREQLDRAAPKKDARDWLALRNRLKAVLTEQEWAEAARSTQYGHYTSAGIVRGMWGAAKRLGFKGGLVLEPGAGKGNFPGLMSDDLAANSSYTGIEYDSITGAILGYLFPDELVRVESYVDTKLPRDFFDLGIGNPPFAGISILADPEYKTNAFKLHDYFFAKTIDRVRPGGLLMFVTSRYTMDKAGDKARKYLAERADLLGAIRLPQTAFKANAGTEVVTDVLFLRKKVPGETFEGGQAWGGIVPVNGADGQPLMISTKEGEPDAPAMVNEYFAAHPEMVLGEHSNAGSMYRAKEYTVKAPAGDIEALFAAAVERLPADVMHHARGSAAEAAAVREIDFNPRVQKEGNYYLNDKGVLMQLDEGVGKAVLGLAKGDEAIIRSFVPLRDALKQSQYDQLADGDWETSLKALRAAYKAFVGAHGPLHQSKVRQVRVKADVLDEDGVPTGQREWMPDERRVYPTLDAIKDDPEWTLVAALETVNEETGEVKEAPALSKRVLNAPQPAQIDTPHDALLAVLNDLGRVDIPEIADRIGLSEEETIAALGTAVYLNPTGGAWTMADEYLSGDVRDKLAEAEAAAKADRRFERNVEALKAAQPQPKSPAQINLALGMNWIPGRLYAQFLKEVSGLRASVEWNATAHQWSVQFLDKGIGAAQNAYRFQRAREDVGTTERHAGELLEHALTGRPIVIKRRVSLPGGGTTEVTDHAAIEAANLKLEQLKAKFVEWAWSDAERTNELVTTYNDKYNRIVPRSFDGRHLRLPGTSALLRIFDHVKRGAWRVIQSGNTYLAHAVGSGKTFEMVISAMEQKRLGLIKKPMVVVPNHMLGQFAREWLELYPAARLMVADENAFHKDKRRQFVSRVALSDLDGVIITHSAFRLLDLDPQFRAKIIDEQIEMLRAAIENTDEADDGRPSPTVKRIEARIEALEQKLKSAQKSESKDQNARFDELGVDMLYVDEAHLYRKLDFGTSRQVKGISAQGSEMALDLYAKARWLDEKNPGRSLVMASGTPITNTLAELYSVMRYLGRNALKADGLEDFDSWAAMYGRETTSLEPNAAGKYEPVTRFAKFVNLPSVIQRFKQFADVLTADNLAALLGDERPKVKGGSREIVVTPKTARYRQYQRVLAKRYEASRQWKPSKDEPNNPDPVIAIIGDGRLAAIDTRFVMPGAPSDPDSKLNRMIDDVIATYRETAGIEYLNPKTKQPDPVKGASMMVFSDLGFGEGVAARRGFSARAWMEKRLRDAGIDMRQVAFMGDYKKSTEKQKLFSDVNAGRVRILVGSSKNMGTGVNAQNRLLDLFHLDSPWYPADLEQREGRIIRQKNQNKTVRIRAYAAKGSYDETMWGMLARKAYFIGQALEGDPNLDEVEDVDSMSQYELAAAMVAEDPRVLQLAGLRGEIAKLERLYQHHESQRQKAVERHRWAQAEIAANRALLPKAEAAAGKVSDLSGKNFSATAGGATFDERKAWGQALKDAARYEASGVAKSKEIGAISGFPVLFKSARTDSAYTWEVVIGTPVERPLIVDGAEDPVQIALKAQNAVADVARLPGVLRDNIERAAAELGALEARVQAPFPMAELLAGKRHEAAAVEADIAAASKDRAWVVTNRDTGMFITVQAHSADYAIDKALDKMGGEPEAWSAEEATQPQPEPDAETAAVAAALGMAGPAAGYGTRLSQRTTGSAGGIPLAAARAVKARVTARMANLPPVEVLQSPADLPADSTLRQFIEARGAMGDVRGALHDGTIYLFADNLEDEATAEHVLAEHEAAHAGLRGLLGRSVDTAMRTLYESNPRLRNQAEALIQQGVPLAEAVEEVIVDIPSAELVKLRGWRRFAQLVRDALRRAGMVKLALRLDGWLSGHLTEQQRADLMVADLVREARAFVTGRRRAGLRTAAADSQAQADWLTAQAKQRGYKTLDDMIERDYEGFDGLAAMWRARNVAPVMSRTAPQFGTEDEARAQGFTLKAYRGVSKASPFNDISSTWLTTSREVAEAYAEEVMGYDDPAVLTVMVKPDGLPRHDASRLTDEQRAALGADSFGNPQAVGIYDRSDDHPLGGSRRNVTVIHAPREAVFVVDGAPRLSRAATLPAPGARTAAERAEAIIQAAAGTPKPVDAFARTLTRITGMERLTAATHGLGARLLDQLVPERVKAGVVSNYGVPEAVIDRRAAMQGSMRTHLAQAGRLIDKLATLTRQESRVAYEWMNGEDTRTGDEIMQDLPAESVAVLREVRTMIDDLSKEAVRLGQLDPEAFKRHRFAYLRRTYFKYAQELTGVEKAARERSIAILGDQYKGRGIVELVPMDKVRNLAPEWWQRKLAAGKADASLKGAKFERLERRAHKGSGTPTLDGMDENARPPKLLEVVYWPAGEPKPAKYADWDGAGTFEVRDVKGANLVLWRDFTKDERIRMGEIDEARYAIGKTLHRMIHDVEVGRYLEWLAQNHAKRPGETVPGTIVEASERYRDTFTPGEWVQVPEAKIPGTSVAKYGKLAGQYIPGPVWNDLRQVVGRARVGPEWWRNILTGWKLAKTALSPVVHTNNIMSNFVMADWHDVSAGHVAKALRIILASGEGKGRGALGRAGNVAAQLGIADREAARAIMERYQASGGNIGAWVTSEIAAEQIAPFVKQLQDELAGAAGNTSPQEIGVYSALQHLLHARFPAAWESFKASKPAQVVGTDARNMIDLYQAEDDVFRLAAWLKAKEDGQSDLEAGKAARRSFLDYDINAPWIAAARQSALPFISFTYRAVPMLIRTAAKSPHKIVKLMAIAAALNALGAMLAGGDDDDEARKMLPEEKAGRVWGMVPKLIRMPWNDAHGSPVFLDIRRWIPVGDVFDLGQTHAALPVPPWLMPGGPLMVLGEILMNKSAFTGKPIALETDTVTEQAAKIADHVWKAFAPNIVLLPGTYAWQGVKNATTGATDAFGREQSVPQALASSVGVKLSSYPPDVLRRNLEARAKAQMAEIDDGIRQLKRQRMLNRIDQDQFEDQVRAQQDKKRKVIEDLREQID